MNSIPARMAGAPATLARLKAPHWQEIRAAFALPSGSAHAARTTFAALLALGLAYELQFDTPYSAAVTVIVTAHPVSGQVLSKSLYRLAGTVIGGVVTLILVGLFGQTPPMFMLALGLWVGLCTAASTLLANFRSYGAVLAGYTVVLITMPAIDHPGSAFDLVIARGSTVGLGIICSAMVAALLSRRTAEATMAGKLGRALSDLADYGAHILGGRLDERQLVAVHRSLSAEFAQLEALVDFAAFESTQVARLKGELRGGIAGMFGCLTALASQRLPEGGTETLTALRQRLIWVLEEIAGSTRGFAALDQQASRLSALRDEIEQALHQAPDVSTLAALDRLCELVDDLILAVTGLGSLAGHGRLGGNRAVEPRTAPDFQWAFNNFVRASVTVWLASLIWFATEWQAGWGMIAVVTPNVALLSVRERPQEDATSFVWGIGLAAVLAFIFNGLVLPEINSFELLALVLAPVIFAGILATLRPKIAFFGLGLSVFFPTLLAPANAMHYDPGATLEGGLAALAGAVLTVLVYRTVLPVDHRRHVRAIVQAIGRDLRELLRAPAAIRRSSWDGRLHGRLVALGARMRSAGMTQDRLFRGGMAALRLGREVLRLRQLSQAVPELGWLVRDVFESFHTSPHQTVHACRSLAESLLSGKAGPDDQIACTRAAASLLEIALLLGRHRHFLKYSW